MQIVCKSKKPLPDKYNLKVAFICVPCMANNLTVKVRYGGL